MLDTALIFDAALLPAMMSLACNGLPSEPRGSSACSSQLREKRNPFHRYSRIKPASTMRNGAGSVIASMAAPAIDAARPHPSFRSPETDQRGHLRSQDGDGDGLTRPDLGAVEFEPDAARDQGSRAAASKPQP